MPLHEREHLLELCRAVMPGVAGVVLSTLTGSALAHEARVQDPDGLAREAAATASVSTSALLTRDDGLYLVVFVPADPLVSSAAPALPA